MRRLNAVQSSSVLKAVKELDAFPKVPESYVETSASGGGVALLTFLLITILVLSEVHYYTQTDLKYSYSVDTDHSSKLKINIDITVASPCASIGADVLDTTGQMVPVHGNLEEIQTRFELTHSQRSRLLMTQRMNAYVREHYHRIHELMWQRSSSGLWMDSSLEDESAAKSRSEGKPMDACRFKGTLSVNKVAGNLHIIAGKPIHFMGGQHAHIGMFVDDTSYNFSHRINSLSFGDHSGGIVNPLDGDELITEGSSHLFQYFIKIVPTLVETRFSTVDTYQYSVTERNRSIDHGHGSHGMPGIFFKYDMAPLRVHVRETSLPLWQFIVNLCGIVGGVFATSGILNSFVGFLVELVCCRYKLGNYASKVEPAVNTSSESSLSSTTSTQYSTVLLTAVEGTPDVSTLGFDVSASSVT